jgi:hypothetical protein
MIEKHGFYEGRSSGFRSEPEELAKILGLVRSNNFHRFEKQKHKIEKPAWTATAFRSLRTI